MKTANIMKAVCVAGLAATCVWGLAACADGASASGTKTYTGGVAATVNGTEIPEDEVTGMVESIRLRKRILSSIERKKANKN